MQLATLQIDTHKFVKLLMAEGFKEEQAEGLLKAMQEITLVGVATKKDIHTLQKEIQDVRKELKEDIHDLRTELKEDIQDIRGEIASMKVWFMSLILGQFIAILGVMFMMFQFFLGA